MNDTQPDDGPQQSAPIEPEASPMPYELERLPDEAFEIHYRSDQRPPGLERLYRRTTEPIPRASPAGDGT
jgi:hypothetical protein